MNRTIALMALSAGICMVAPAYAQDTHESINRQSLQCFKNIVNELSLVKNEADAMVAAGRIREQRAALLNLSIRQMDLPPPTLKEQAEMTPFLQETQKQTANLGMVIVDLTKRNLMTAELQQAINELQTLSQDLAKASQEKALKAEPFPKDAQGNTYLSLMKDNIARTNQLAQVLSAMDSPAACADAIAEMDSYAAFMLDMVKKQNALPPLTSNQQAVLMQLGPQLAEAAKNLSTGVMKAMMSPHATQEFRLKVQELTRLVQQMQELRAKAAAQ